MKSLSDFSIIIIAVCIAAASCAKVPEKLKTTVVKIDSVISNNQEQFSVKVSSRIENENSDTAFIDTRGEVVFIDPESDNKIILSVPFTAPAILPYNSAPFECEKKFDERDVLPLVLLFGIDKEEFTRNNGIKDMIVNDKLLRLTLSSYKKENIITLLKEKVHNEKN